MSCPDPTSSRGLRPCRVTGPGPGQSRGFTLVELLVVIAIISVLAGALLSTIKIDRDRANIANCTSNLKRIAELAMIYADTGTNRFFPLAKGSNPAAHESLNVLVEASPGLSPKLFICRSSREDEAVIDENGRFSLDAETCSYAWTGEKLAPTDAGRVLASCKHVRTGDSRSGHPGGVVAVFTDGHAEFMTTDRLDPDSGLPEGLVP